MQYQWIPDKNWPDGRRWLLTPVNKRPIDAVGRVFMPIDGIANALEFGPPAYTQGVREFNTLQDAARWLLDQVR